MFMINFLIVAFIVSLAGCLCFKVLDKKLLSGILAVISMFILFNLATESIELFSDFVDEQMNNAFKDFR